MRRLEESDRNGSCHPYYLTYMWRMKEALAQVEISRLEVGLFSSVRFADDMVVEENGEDKITSESN